MNAPTDEREVSRRAVRATRSFVALADTLVDDFDVVEMLDRLVTDCVDLLDVSAAGILLLNSDRDLDVVASTDEASRLVEVFQLQSHSGPCISALETGEMLSIPDPDELRRRWPVFGRAVDKVGFAAVHAFPMRLRNETVGALNLFDLTDKPLSDFDRQLGQALADVATVGILQHRAVERSSELAAQLQLALSTRITVEQAKGMIAEYGGVDMAEAFRAIRAYSRENRLKLSAVSRDLIGRVLEPGVLIPARRTR